MTAEPDKLLVPAALYDEALAFCNARRAENNLEPITELPAGLAASYTECPCAKGIGDIWIAEHLYWIKSERGKPHGISQFVAFFDENAVKDMLTKPVRDG